MKKNFAFAIILFVLSLFLASTAKAGGTINIYYAGSSDNQVRSALDRIMPKLTFVDDPSNAEVFVLNGVIPNNEIISQRVQSGVSGLVLFLSPEIKSEQIQELFGSQDAVSLIQKNNSVSLKTIKSNDVWFDWMNEIDWVNAPQIKERFILSGVGLTPLVQSDSDHSTILGYVQFGNDQPLSAVIFTPFLEKTNDQLQNWKYFDFLVYQLVSTAGRRGSNTYSIFSTFPTPTPMPSSVSKGISSPIALIVFLILTILIIGIFLLWRRKKYLSNSKSA